MNYIVVDVRVKVQYTRRNIEVCKKVCTVLGETIDFTYQGYTSRKQNGHRLYRQGRKEISKETHQDDGRFPLTALDVIRNYASAPHRYAFNDGRQGTFKSVDLCMVLGIDAEIESLLEEWRMDLSERGIVDIRKKQGQIVHTFDRFMLLGIPTGVPVPVVEGQDRVYEQGHHTTKEPLKFSFVKKFPQGMPWVPVKEDKERPNNGRLAFIMLLKEDQEPRMRQIFKELKDTNGLTKHVGRTA